MFADNSKLQSKLNKRISQIEAKNKTNYIRHDIYHVKDAKFEHIL